VRRLELDLEPGSFAVARLDAGEPLPDWVSDCLTGGDFVSVTRSTRELSIVCPDSCVPESVRAERGLRALCVRGPLPFTETGVLASLASLLAAAGVSLFALSTFDTDYLFVAAPALSDAVTALTEGGHGVYGSA
jgi:hypothetical protein